MDQHEARSVLVQHYLGLGFSEDGLHEALVEALNPSEAAAVESTLLSLTEPITEHRLAEAFAALGADR